MYDLNKKEFDKTTNPFIVSITKQELYDPHAYAHLKVLHQIVLHYLH